MGELPLADDTSSRFLLLEKLLGAEEDADGGNWTPLYFDGVNPASTEPNISEKSIWNISLNSSSVKAWGWCEVDPCWGMIIGAVVAGIIDVDGISATWFDVVCLDAISWPFLSKLWSVAWSLFGFSRFVDESTALTSFSVFEAFSDLCLFLLPFRH